MQLRHPFTVIDGGLSTVLEERGHDLRHPLWTGRLLVEAPEALVEAHVAYLEAGAEVIITSSYQASTGGLTAMGLTPRDADAALRSTTELAQHAVARHGGGALVAASVGPYGATLADGSEYRGDYDIDPSDLAAFHAQRLRLLVEPGPDLLAIETIPSVLEALAIAEAVAAVDPMPSWLAFVCRDEARTVAGDRIEDAVVAAHSVPGIVAVGVNCTDPRLIEPLLERAATATELPLVAYANGGQHWNAVAGAWQGTPVGSDEALTDRWVAAGARLIGGCCGVSPADIVALREHRDAGERHHARHDRA